MGVRTPFAQHVTPSAIRTRNSPHPRIVCSLVSDRKGEGRFVLAVSDVVPGTDWRGRRSGQADAACLPAIIGKQIGRVSPQSILLIPCAERRFGNSRFPLGSRYERGYNCAVHSVGIRRQYPHAAIGPILVIL